MVGDEDEPTLERMVRRAMPYFLGIVGIGLVVLFVLLYVLDFFGIE